MQGPSQGIRPASPNASAPARFLKDLYADAVQMRLWPLALVLLVAMIAVPVLLSSHPSKIRDQGPPPSQFSASTPFVAETEPIATLTGTDSFRRHVRQLSRKDPFVQQAQVTVPTVARKTQAPRKTVARAVPVAAPVTGPVSTPVTTPVAPVPKTGASKPARPRSGSTRGTEGLLGTAPHYVSAIAAKVKFGWVGHAPTTTLLRWDLLPDHDNPVLIYVGAASNGRAAQFLLPDKGNFQGDGTCKPNASECYLLTMLPGDDGVLQIPSSDGFVRSYEVHLVRMKHEKEQASVRSAPHRRGGI